MDRVGEGNYTKNVPEGVPLNLCMTVTNFETTVHRHDPRWGTVGVLFKQKNIAITGKSCQQVAVS